MKIQAALAALALWLAPMIACAQGGPEDPTCADVIANRGAYGRVIHIYGDSIARGYALGKFEDGADPLDPAHPLYGFRSIASTANWALQTNGRSERFAYCGNISATAIAARVSSGVIRSGDMVVLEDAGSVTDTINAYYASLWNARVAAAASGVTVVMMTMFDYCHDANMACLNTNMQFDLPRYTGSSNAGTLNDAIRRAATVTTNPVSGSALPGQTVLIDMNWLMDSWRNSALNVDGVDVMLGDGVHPNVWGQAKMTQQILAAAGLRQYINDVDPLQDAAEANYQALAYGSATFTGARARVYVDTLLGN